MNAPRSISFDRARRLALTIGIAGLVAWVIGALFGIDLLFQSYLVGYFFWLGLSLGSGAILMIHQLTGGRWGEAISGILASALRCMILMAVLMVPLLLGMERLYQWVGHADELGSKAAYLNVPFFVSRSGVYVGLWLLGALMLTTARSRRVGSWPALGAAGLIVYFLTMTFASIDWVMSLDAHWFSSIFGLQIAMGQMLGALAMAIVVLAMLHRATLQSVATPIWHDLGNFLLAAVALWAYLSFSQFLIIWYGNMPEGTRWYVPRVRGGWGAVAMLLIALHFAVPLIVLLARRSKREPIILLTVAGALLVMHAVDVMWIIVPSFARATGWWVLMDVAAIVGIGGLWLFMFLGDYTRRMMLRNEGR